jgi:hypothetical protein
MFFVGCATAQRMHDVHAGMHRVDVVRILGHPWRTNSDEGSEYLRYQLREPDHRFHPVEYFVHLQNDQVDVFGKVSDFHISDHKQAQTP